MFMQLSVIGAASEVRPYSSVMLQIVVEVAGTVCDAIVQYSLKQLIVSLLQQLIEVWHVRWAEAASLAAAEKCVCALAVRRRDNIT